MVNCHARILRGTDQLQAGQRVGVSEVELHAAPAYLASPKRAWERVAAIEGNYAGTLHVHTTNNLQMATRAEIADHPLAGSYQIAGVQVSGFGWRLALERRP